MGNKNPLTKLESLYAREEELKKQIVEVEKEAKERARKDDFRKAKLLGEFMLAEIEASPEIYKKLMGKFDATVTGARDRALFGFEQIKPIVEEKIDTTAFVEENSDIVAE